MNDELHLSENGQKLIQHFESCHLKSYLCPAGKPTVGWGTTGLWNGKPIALGLTITQAEADQRFREDMIRFENMVKQYIKAELSQQQFDALVSLAYNAGPVTLISKSSTLARLLNAGDYSGASAQFPRWNKIRKGWALEVCPGLVRRRAAEQYLFDTGHLKFYFDK